MNGEVCCILGVCCPPGSPRQREALTQMIQKSRPHLSQERVTAKVDQILTDHDQFRKIAQILDAA